MKKKLLSVLLSVAMIATMLIGCGSSEPAEDTTEEDAVVSEEAGVAEALVEELKTMVPDEDYSDFTIGFCGMTLNNEYHILVANAVQQSCKALGIQCKIQAGSEHASVEEQLVIIENYISQGVDGIILVPAASQGLIAALQACGEAGIPVINLDTQLDQTTLDTLDYDIPFYGTDNYKGGQMVGELFAEQYPDGAKVAILRGIQGHTNDEHRYTGFLDKAGDITLVAEQHCDWETDKGYTAVQNILQANPDLEVVYCENDLMGVGAYQAIEEAGLTDQVKVFSYDGITEGLNYVKDGKFISTCAQQPIEMGKLGVVNMAKVFAGESAEDYIDTGCKLVTLDNVEETLVEVEFFAQSIAPTE